MRIRRPIAALLTALALLGGGATVAGCSDPVNATTGTPKDTSKNTSGSEPTGVSQGQVPDLSNRKHEGQAGETGNQ